MKAIREFYNGAVSFCNNHKLFVLVSIIVPVLSLGPMIFWYNYGLDTDQMIYSQDEKLNEWFGLQRYGLILLKKIFSPMGFNLWLAKILTLVFLILISILIGYITYRVAKLKNRDIRLYLIPILLISPIAIEQLSFFLQSAECLFGVCLVILSCFSILEIAKRRKYKLLIIPAIVLIFSYTIYQSLVPFTVGFGSYLLFLELIGNGKKKDFGLYILAFCSVFIISVVVMKIIPYVVSYINIGTFELAKNEYLESQIGWGKRPAFNVLLSLGDGIIRGFVLLPLKNDYYRPAIFLVSMLILTYGIIRLPNRDKIEKAVCFFALMMSLFIIPVGLGQMNMYRSEYPNYVFAIMFMSILATLSFGKNKVIFAILMILGLVQVFRTADLAYIDALRFRREEKEAIHIAESFRSNGVINGSEYGILVYGKQSDVATYGRGEEFVGRRDGADHPYGAIEGCWVNSVWTYRFLKSLGYEFKNINTKDLCKKYENILKNGENKYLDRDNKIFIVRFN